MSGKQRKWRFWHVLLAFLLLAGIGVVMAYRQLSTPLPPSIISADHVPDLDNGRHLYLLGGCISCHRGTGAHVELPAGGRKVKVRRGEIPAPNITPDEETGIGRWQAIDFVNAMRKGLGPDGTHYLPSFPYTSYAWMHTADLLDLFAYLKSLPAARNPVPRDDGTWGRFTLAFWKWLALPGRPFRPLPGRDALWNRGAYLVLGPGRCAECHTPRNAIFLLDRRQWLAGAPLLSGKGRAPSLRGLKRRGRYKDVNDLVQALKHGEAMGYEDLSAGGMGEVQAALSKLPEEDLKAIATYLMSLP